MANTSTRIMSLAHVTGVVVFQSTIPQSLAPYTPFIPTLKIFLLAYASGNCNRFVKALTWTYTLAVSSTNLLFFFRVRAVFNNNRLVVAFFGFTWLAVVGACLTTTQGITGTNIGPTKYCLTGDVKEYVNAATIVPLINDTLVFLAITYQLMRHSYITQPNSMKTRLRICAFGDHLPAISKALLKDGQLYYL